MIVYVGTYTRRGSAEGIYVYRMDQATGVLSHLQTLTGPGTDNASFLALHPARRFLYACNETEPTEGLGPGVSAFAIDGRDGMLSFLNRLTSHGVSPCYVTVDPTGRWMLVANFRTGVVAVYPIREDGRLGEASCIVQHEGRSVHTRQQGPHAHSVVIDPTGKRVLAADLGADRVFVHRLDLESGILAPEETPFAQVSTGAGPRHISFHPSGRFVYVNNEIDSTLSAFAYDVERGTLQILDTRSTLPDDVFGQAAGNHTAQGLVHPNGRFVYVSNRGHDSIAMFEIDGETGRPRPLGWEPTQGKTPRNFNIDPSGRFLYAGNSGSDTIVTFRIDERTGRLTATGQVTPVPSAVCIQFRPD
jgi:6-phosphogluconolactonase